MIPWQVELGTNPAMRQHSFKHRRMFEDWRDPAFKYWLEFEREKRPNIILCNGCFDLLHPGHMMLLQWAACGESEELGPVNQRLVIAAANADATITLMKTGSRPFLTLGARLYALRSIRGVRVAVGFAEKTPEELAIGLRPLRAIVKGGDYSFDVSVPGSCHAEKGVVFAPKIFDLSTSLLEKVVASTVNHEQESTKKKKDAKVPMRRTAGARKSGRGRRK